MSDVMKRCPQCAVTKPVEAFAPDAYASSGRKSACRECDARRARVYYWRRGGRAVKHDYYRRAGR